MLRTLLKLSALVHAVALLALIWVEVPAAFLWTGVFTLLLLAATRTEEDEEQKDTTQIGTPYAVHLTSDGVGPAVLDTLRRLGGRNTGGGAHFRLEMPPGTVRLTDGDDVLYMAGADAHSKEPGNDTFLFREARGRGGVNRLVTYPNRG